MSIITIKPSQLAGALHKEAVRFTKATLQACHGAARKLQTHLKNQTDELGVTDTGHYKNAWKVQKTGRGASVVNDAPYAGIIEMGARPHKVSKAGIEAIAKWVERKLLVAQGPVHEKKSASGRITRKNPSVDKSGAMSIAYAIAKKIEREGVKGRFIARDALPLATKYYGEELQRILRGAAR